MFRSNTYAAMVAYPGGGAAASYKDFALQDSGHIYLQMFLNETFENTFGGALYFNELNTGGMAIVMNSTFYNTFGVNGGAIYMARAGIIYARNVTFSGDPGFKKRSEHLEELLAAKIETERNWATPEEAAFDTGPGGSTSVADLIVGSYVGERGITSLVSENVIALSY